MLLFYWQCLPMNFWLRLKLLLLVRYCLKCFKWENIVIKGLGFDFRVGKGGNLFSFVFWFKCYSFLWVGIQRWILITSLFLWHCDYFPWRNSLLKKLGREFKEPLMNLILKSKGLKISCHLTKNSFDAIFLTYFFVNFFLWIYKQYGQRIFSLVNHFGTY